MFEIGEKTVLITGASRGIGAEAAKLAQTAGARILAHASAPSAKAHKLVSEGVVAEEDLLFEDLSASGAGARLLSAAVARAGRLDAVVNNAGVYLPASLAGDQTAWDEGWNKTLAVNLKAPADICRAAVAHFREHKGGRIINIASRAGHRGDGVDFAVYAASKAGLIAMTKTYARALSGENILFYVVAPGWVETRMTPEDIEKRKNAVSEIPLGRVAQPNEVAAMIVFLLSDACRSATGSTFDINGASYVR